SKVLGRIAIGRIRRGTIRKAQEVAIMAGDKLVRKAKIGILHTFQGLEKVETASASVGEIVSVTGIEDFVIGTTYSDVETQEGLPMVGVDEPTLTMNFQVNTSPYAGQEGKYVTSRQIRERLTREVLHNVALRVEDTENPDKFRVFGRGELHLGVLLENMRREGYELAVSRPRAVVKEIEGQMCEPYETLAVDLDDTSQGAVMQALGERGAQLTGMHADGRGRVRLDYTIPSRGLIGFQTDFRTMTSGTGLMHHIFDHFGAVLDREVGQRQNGVLIANSQGKALAYALFSLQERGKLMIGHGDEVYEGQVIGIHSRDNDLVVNPLKGKKLTNIRAAGKDENVVLVPPIRYTLEQAMEFIGDDELVEVTPTAIRLRKRFLKEHERKRSGKAAEEAVE
ncbi:MAG TPA: EF-Tu/IF-2/RF-3 family GTPase, partial [Povalibacter sp.]